MPEDLARQWVVKNSDGAGESIAGWMLAENSVLRELLGGIYFQLSGLSHRARRGLSLVWTDIRACRQRLGTGDVNP